MSAKFSWSISTPDGVMASGECDFLVVPTTGGELGVLADHAALVACVAPGVLRVTAPTYPADSAPTYPADSAPTYPADSAPTYPADSATQGVRTIGVGPGVVDVRDNVVRLLVSRAEKPGP
jgi:F0F1-type ATP synthase epsilon subunit